MVIRTKIVATVGPACGEGPVLKRMAEAGCDLFRINFSHGNDEQRDEFLRNIRSVETELGEPLGVIADLCGPKIRIGAVAGGSVLLVDSQQLVIQRDPIEGGPQRVSTTLAELVDQVQVGQKLLLDDGKIRLEVTEVRPPKEIVCKVIRGGVLGSGKGINLPETALRLSALTEKDRRDAEWIAERDFDYVALSFVRSGQDVGQLRRLLEQNGCGAQIIAKIEKPQAMEHIEEIIEAADAIMVARGDLGVEMDLPAVPVAQKQIASLCQTAGKCCIIATQMLETMTHSAMPTRAEVSDVANAVLDRADAVMLSGETAVGKFPVETVAMMNQIVEKIQSYSDQVAEPRRVGSASARTTAALAGAVRHILQAGQIAAVAVYTATGATARLLAKNHLPRPILAMAADRAVVRRMCLYYGVVSMQAEAPKHTRDILALASKFALQRGVARLGERIVVLSGRPIGKPGATNTLVVHTIS